MPQDHQSRPVLHRYNLAFLDSIVTGLWAGTLVVYLLFCVSDYADMRYGKRVMLTAIPVAMGLLRFQQIVMVEGRGEQPSICSTTLPVDDVDLLRTHVRAFPLFLRLHISEAPCERCQIAIGASRHFAAMR